MGNIEQTRDEGETEKKIQRGRERERHIGRGRGETKEER